MKISFKNVSDLRLKVVICAFVFVMGVSFIVLSMIVAVSLVEYQTVNGTYASYRKERVSMHTIKRYLTVKFFNAGQIEYEIHSIVISAFERQELQWLRLQLQLQWN